MAMADFKFLDLLAVLHCLIIGLTAGISLGSTLASANEQRSHYAVEQVGRRIYIRETGPRTACNSSRSYFLGSANGVDCEHSRPIFAALSYECVGDGTYEALLPPLCGVYEVTVKLSMQQTILTAETYFQSVARQWSSVESQPVIWTKTNIVVGKVDVPLRQEAREGLRQPSEVAGVWYEPKVKTPPSWCMDCPKEENDGMGEYLWTFDVNHGAISGANMPANAGHDAMGGNSPDYRSPRDVQSCLSGDPIKRIAFVGDSLSRYRMNWWWWLLDSKVDIQQKFGWSHDDAHVRVGATYLSWFFDPYGKRLLNALSAATKKPCVVKGCPPTSSKGVNGLDTRKKAGSVHAKLNLRGFDAVVVSYGLWTTIAPPHFLPAWVASMKELARQVTIYKNLYRERPNFVWVDVFSEVAVKNRDPHLFTLLRDVAHQHLEGAPVSIVDGHAISRGREITAWDQKHYVIKSSKKGGGSFMSYVNSVERETSAAIVHKLCSRRQEGKG